MGWIKYALVTACVLAAADLCVKVAAGRLSNSLAVLSIRQLHILDRPGLGAVAMGTWHTATCPSLRYFSEYGCGIRVQRCDSRIVCHL